MSGLLYVLAHEHGDSPFLCLKFASIKTSSSQQTELVGLFVVLQRSGRDSAAVTPAI